MTCLPRILKGVTFLGLLASSPAAWAVDLLSENFDQLPLTQVVTFQSEVRHRAAWTTTPPTGAGVEGAWSIDNSLMPPTSGSPLVGVAEFEGWSFVDRNWWVDTSGDQDRRLFVSASGTIAVADPDEWDDFGAPTAGGALMDSTLRISSIPLQGVAPNTAQLFFHSSWRFEDTQKASLIVKYNDPLATQRTLLDWSSIEGAPNFKPDAPNEAVSLPIMNPAGATSATLEFRMYDSGNDWWWAIDNLNMFTGAAPAVDGALRLVINRDTQEVKIVNNTSSTVNLRGYSVESRFGTLDETAANFLGETNLNWQVFNNPSGSELSEGYIPNQYAMPTLTANPTLGQINLGNAWRKFHEDISDIGFQYLVAGNDTPRTGIIEFTGNSGVSYESLDLNFDGSISLGDYATFLAGYNISLAGKTAAQRHVLGDLDADGAHSVRDFLRFKQQFDVALGAGAFEAALAAVPEPAAGAMLLVGLALSAGLVRRAPKRAVLAAAVVGLALTQTSAHANFPLLVENFESVPLGPSPEENPAALVVWNGVGPAGWTVDDSGVPGVGNPATDGITDWAGWAFVDQEFWVSADDQNRSFFTRASGTVMVADADEWQDGAISPIELFDAFVTTPVLNIPAGTPAGKIRLAFDSSWRPEGMDETGTPGIGVTNNQTATIKASYNGGAKQTVLTWDSNPASPTYKLDNENEGVEISLNYNGTASTVQVEFGLGKAWNDWWWAIDNVRIFIPADPSVLRIDTTTGNASIIGGDVISTSITGFDVSSVNGNLAPAANAGMAVTKPDSIDGSDADTIVGNNINESWQRGAANANQFAEFFLDGSSGFTELLTENLGKIFNPATLLAARDVKFAYTTIFGDVIDGLVEYVASPPSTGDFDSDGDVDGGDLLAWQRGFGTGTTRVQGDANGDNAVNSSDLAVWQSQYGAAPATPAAAAVPEPTSMMLFALFAAAAGVKSRVWNKRAALRRSAAPYMAGLFAFGVVASTAHAQVIPPPKVDRDYRMGDNDPGAVSGATLTVTRDNAGVLGQNQLIDMLAQTRFGGQPTYITVAGRPDGGTGLGIRLNPNPNDRQFLRTGIDEALNFPERSPSSTEGTLPGGTLNYSFITDRGFQLWVQPFAATEAHIVMDSNNHGALVTATGKLGMRYSGFDYPGVTTVVPNTWYHVMVVRPFGPNNGSILYVNGVAEAAATGIYNGEDAPNDEMNPVNHDNSALVVGANTSESTFQLATQRFFRGVVDDLEMFVIGLNPTADYGEFSLRRDNDYVAHFGPATAGDLNGDNVINMTDVATFATNWLSVKTLNWTQGGTPRALAVGDLTTRAKGDFNFDGRINLSDWAILNNANPAMAAAAMAMIGSVPEPSTLTLACLVALLAGGARRRRTAPARNAQGVAGTAQPIL